MGKEIVTTLLSGNMPSEQVLSLFISKVCSDVPRMRCTVAIFDAFCSNLLSFSEISQCELIGNLPVFLVFSFVQAARQRVQRCCRDDTSAFRPSQWSIIDATYCHPKSLCCYRPWDLEFLWEHVSPSSLKSSVFTSPSLERVCRCFPLSWRTMYILYMCPTV